MSAAVSVGYIVFLASQFTILFCMKKWTYTVTAWLFLVSNMASMAACAVLEPKLHFSSLEVIICLLNAGTYFLCNHNSVFLWNLLSLLVYLSSAYSFYNTVLEAGSVVVTKEVYVANRAQVVVRLFVDILKNYYHMTLMRKV